MDSSGFNVRVVTWSAHEAAIKAIREKVFIEEQDVPVEEEWDGRDPDCLHLLVDDENGEPIATARMLLSGKIGRMAVYKNFRGRGVGRAMLEALLKIAQERGLTRVELDAQTRAMDFYRASGFIAIGDEFLDAGIPHYRMYLDLGPGLDRVPRL
jgi:predicted GNAT family N-acyltransferase